MVPVGLKTLTSSASASCQASEKAGRATPRQCLLFAASIQMKGFIPETAAIAYIELQGLVSTSPSLS